MFRDTQWLFNSHPVIRKHYRDFHRLFLLRADHRFVLQFLNVCMCVCVFFIFEEGYFLVQTEVSVVKPDEFKRDSGCLAHDEFLVIFKGGLICNSVIVGTVLHCSM